MGNKQSKQQTSLSLKQDDNIHKQPSTSSVVSICSTSVSSRVLLIHDPILIQDNQQTRKNTYSIIENANMPVIIIMSGHFEKEDLFTVKNLLFSKQQQDQLIQLSK